MSKNSKNLRLSFSAWQELRLIKFRMKLTTYSELLEIVLNEYKGESSLSDDVRMKPPTDGGDLESIKDMNKADKTIVVSEKIHNGILDMKNEYMIAKGFASRGPNAVSISDIMLDLLKKFKDKHQIN
ncbi:MAG: hypothetical protein HeimC2_08390 [Candidatus Heimdallarchaeota archaeon LC_2]|nr:MAG: hypothetical protein HeimC2_08390 [Candidatus Heimdallarchaeota archaeon LC_2]